MCPAALPVGAEAFAIAAEPAAPAGADGFSRMAACRIVGIAPSALARLETALAAEADHRLPARLAFSDLLALAVAREIAGRLGPGAAAYTVGLRDLLLLLAARPELDLLDPFVALVGRDFARLTDLPPDHLRAANHGFVVVPLAPILSELRDLVFP